MGVRLLLYILVLSLTCCSFNTKNQSIVKSPKKALISKSGDQVIQDEKTAKDLTEEGDQLLAEGLLAPATDKYKEAINKDKDYALAHLQLAKAYGKTKNMELYEKELKETVKIDPKNTEARYILASWYFAKGDTDSALKETDELKVIDPENDQYSLFLVMIYNQKKEHKKAIEELKWLSKKHPENVGYLLSLGNMYKKINDKEKAKSYLNKVIKLAPESIEAIMAKDAMKEHNEPTTDMKP